MRLVSVLFAPLCAGLFVTLPVAAQTGSPLETEFELEAVTVITPLSSDEGAPETDAFLGELSLVGNSEKVLENGVRIRVRGALRLQKDHEIRPGGIGGFGTDPFAPVGAFSGLSSAQMLDGNDLRARLETAYLQIDGGYGELRFGKDRGVAARFYEGSKSVLSHARLDSSLLDPTGLSTIRSRHNLTGPSAKLSYASPRLLGIRAGASFSPSADADGLDRRPAAGTGALSPKTERAIELALNGTRRLRESGWRFDVGLGWSNAKVSDRVQTAPYSDIETWSAGTRIEKDDWTFGTSWLNSDNGLQNSDYSAWSAGLHKSAYGADFSAEFGQSEDDGAGLNSTGWRLGAARDFGPFSRLAVAYVRDEIEGIQNEWTSEGVVLEITLSQEIVQLTGN